MIQSERKFALRLFGGLWVPLLSNINSLRQSLRLGRIIMLLLLFLFPIQRVLPIHPRHTSLLRRIAYHLAAGTGANSGAARRVLLPLN